ncbi:hypothetical protein H257_12838 [Aphanomyces astaci]|uniref:HECT-type E3 ubiquitin transferase n=3 Tax=Aphanomyces astaci TaxID=112090 RepID=W4FWY4_APHAT|nr:hypothetical protein H257_12838 [Aphanomyces astaci]ETV72035.1 hypothetical protein H257_12838 [Aphanomyces astaci]|eukprot:XP_009838478.1 hypothetical protein H257_12838 [Aphanomyces astaci]
MEDPVAGVSFSVGFAVAFLIVLCYFRYSWLRDEADDALLSNEFVGHLAGLTRDQLENTDSEAQKWTCNICDFYNADSSPACVLCDTARELYLVVSPAFEQLDRTLLPSNFTDKQRAARLRKQWRRGFDGRVWSWHASDQEAAAQSSWQVVGRPNPQVDLALMALQDATAGVTLLGQPLTPWWFGQLDQLTRLSFSLKYAWLLEQLAANYDGHARLVVSRDTILEQSLTGLAKTPLRNLCTLSVITLEHETAVDAGGVTREWYSVLALAILEPSQGLFIVTNQDDQSFFINPNSERVHGPNHLERYLAIGRLLGRAIIDEQVLPFHFCVPLFKMLLGYPVSIQDIRYLDPTVYSSLTYIRDCDDVDDLALTFSVSVDTDVPEVELVVGGRDVGVTNANKAEYVERMVQYLMFERVAPQLQRLVQGLYDVLPQELLMPFDYKELELILCGFSEIDVGDWKRSTIVSKSLEDVVGWFWDVVEFDMTPSDRAKLLQFTTGSSRVPIQGFKGLTSYDGRLCPFSLHGVPYEYGIFPKVHSCFNRIDLPIYPSRALLAEGLFALVNIQSMAFTMV